MITFISKENCITHYSTLQLLIIKPHMHIQKVVTLVRKHYHCAVQ